jgi:hypothetical protein
MRDGSAQIPRGLWGYRRRAVLRVLDERDFVLRQSQERLERADVRLAELEDQLRGRDENIARMEKELDVTREELERREGQLQEMWGRISSLEDESPGNEVSRIIHDELSRVLTTAQEAAEQMVERARTTAEGHLAEARRVMAEADVERARIRSWRAEAGPYVSTLKSRLDGVRERVRDVPTRIRQALDLVSEGVATLDSGLAEMESIPEPPGVPEASEGFAATSPSEDATTPDTTTDLAAEPRVEVSSGEGDEGLRVIEWTPEEEAEQAGSGVGDVASGGGGS